MARFTNSSLDKLRDAVDIVDLINGYTDLRRAGSQFTGLCPFHEERTPSFHVRLPLASFKCFGCGASGDVIEFVRRIKGISFVAAIDELIGNVTPKPLTAPERHERLRQQLKYRTARDSGAIA